MEREFLRQVYLGESVAPYRLLKPVPGIIPWDPDSKRLLDAAAAQQVGYPYLAAWLDQGGEHLTGISTAGVAWHLANNWTTLETQRAVSGVCDREKSGRRQYASDLCRTLVETAASRRCSQ